MHVVSWETNKTRFSKNTSPQIGENQNCPTWVRSPLLLYSNLAYFRRLRPFRVVLNATLTF